MDVPSNFAIPADQMEFEYPQKNSPSKMAAASAHAEYSAEELKIADCLRKQIEFYFGESNLHKDKHFRNLLNQSSQQSPFNTVPVATILNFNRVKAIFNQLGEWEQVPNLKFLVYALKSSKVVKMTKDNTLIKRRIPFKITSLTKIEQNTIVI